MRFVSVVALTVGVMSFPISLVADRVGRVSRDSDGNSLGAGTIACGLSGNFLMMFVARAFVGLGEAAYGSAGGAILVSIFPARMHAMVMGTFLAAALFGSVLGVTLGGLIAQQWGLAHGLHRCGEQAGWYWQWFSRWWCGSRLRPAE